MTYEKERPWLLLLIALMLYMLLTTIHDLREFSQVTVDFVHAQLELNRALIETLPGSRRP